MPHSASLPDNPTDQQLISDYLKGNETSLEFLVKRYLKPIYSFIYRYVGNAKDAEDLTQEVFVRAWRNIKKFNPQRIPPRRDLRGEQNKSPAPHRTCSGAGFKTWLFAIAKNASIDFLRKKRPIPFSKFENEKGDNILLDTLADPSPLPNELLERKDIALMLSSAMEKLSPKYRSVLLLRYNDHFTFREIAESLNKPLHTVKSQHRRALILLKKILEEAF